MLKVNVTQEHIDKGERYSTSACPIARALKDVLPADSCAVNVRAAVAVWFQNSGYYRAWLPHSAQDFVVEFDSGQDVEPFSFELDADV